MLYFIIFLIFRFILTFFFYIKFIWILYVLFDIAIEEEKNPNISLLA